MPDSSPSKLEERQARHSQLLGYGDGGVRRASAARVVIVGAGGLGCPALQVLCSAGVGHVRIIDSDVVERSNLARQWLYREHDIGESKANVAARVLRSVAPDAVIEPRRIHLDESNSAALIAGADVVIDTTDHWPTRFAVADACAEAGVPLVWGSVLGWDGMLTVFAPGGPGIDDLLDRTTQVSAPPRDCATVGVFAPLCAEIGAAMAGEALRLVAEAGVPLVGVIRVWDARSGRVRELPIAGGAARESPWTATEHFPTRISVQALPNDAVLIDVRPAPHPDLALRMDSLHVPLEEFDPPDTLVARVPIDRPLVVACALGPRARAAADLLREAGAERVAVLEGGIPALAPLLTP